MSILETVSNLKKLWTIAFETLPYPSDHQLYIWSAAGYNDAVLEHAVVKA